MILPLLLFLIANVSLSVDNANLEKLNNDMQYFADSNRYYASVAFIEDGKITYQNATGIIDLQSNRKSQVDTKYKIGSISKTFTAVLILKAIEEGKLEFETKLNKFYPMINNADKISIDMLLNHSSGIHNFTSDEIYRIWQEKTPTRIEMLQYFYNLNSEFEPGSQNSYSNTGYILLGYILENIYDKQYHEILQEKICKPIGLESTYFGGTKIDISKNEALSFEGNVGEINNYNTDTDANIPHAAGALLSTPSELLKFAHELFEGNIISQEMLDKMTEIQNGYGRGLFTMPFYDMKFYSHTGGIDGYASVFGYNPEKKIGMACVSNLQDYDVNDYYIMLLSDYFGKDYSLPEFSSYKLSAEELSKYEGYFTSSSFPLDIEVISRDEKIFIKPTGQPEVRLELEPNHVFVYDAANLKITYHKAAMGNYDEMTVEQMGGKYIFKKQK